MPDKDLEFERRMKAIEAGEEVPEVGEKEPAEKEKKPEPEAEAKKKEPEKKEEPPAKPEPEAEEPPEKEEVPAEPDDNAERSRLGRKVKEMQDRLVEMQEAYDRLSSKPAPAKPEPESEVEDDDGEPVFLTKKELEAQMDARVEAYQARKAAEQEEYNQEFNDAFVAAALEAKDDLEIATEISNEMSSIKIKETGNADADARLLYHMARGNVMKRLRAEGPERENPLKGETPDGPLGAGHQEKVAAPAPKKPLNLDPDAADFVRMKGWDEDKVRKVLAEGENDAYIQQLYERGDIA